jgi:hypothetical protein
MGKRGKGHATQSRANLITGRSEVDRDQGKRTCNTIAGQPYHRASEVDRNPPLETKRRRLQTQFKPVRAKPNALDARIQRAQTFGRGRWRDD